MNAQVIRNGIVSLKEEGFASFMFLRKWLVLKGETLSIHKTEVRRIGAQSPPRARPNRSLVR